MSDSKEQVSTVRDVPKTDDSGTLTRKIDGKFSAIVTALSQRPTIINTVSGFAIPDDEPMFLLRAKDRNALRTVVYYLALCKQDGCTDLHLAGIHQEVQKFIDFMNQHPDRMKEPGITRHLRLEGPAQDSGLKTGTLEESNDEARNVMERCERLVEDNRCTLRFGHEGAHVFGNCEYERIPVETHQHPASGRGLHPSYCTCTICFANHCGAFKSSAQNSGHFAEKEVAENSLELPGTAAVFGEPGTTVAFGKVRGVGATAEAVAPSEKVLSDFRTKILALAKIEGDNFRGVALTFDFRDPAWHRAALSAAILGAINSALALAADTADASLNEQGQVAQPVAPSDPSERTQRIQEHTYTAFVQALPFEVIAGNGGDLGEFEALYRYYALAAAKRLLDSLEISLQAEALKARRI